MAYTAYEPMTLEEILARVKKVDTDGSGIALVQRAYDYAADAHKDQKRPVSMRRGVFVVFESAYSMPLRS